MVLASALELQPIASPSTWSRSAMAVSDGSAGQSMKMTTARSAMLPTAAARERRRLLPGTTCLVVKEPLDGVEDRVLVLSGLGGARGAGRGGGSDLLPHAVVLLPALHRIIEVDDLSLPKAHLHHPTHLPRAGLGETAHAVPVPPAER